MTFKEENKTWINIDGLLEIQIKMESENVKHKL